MSKLVWDRPAERYYGTGVKKCVLYKQALNGTYPKGVAWNGITAINESPSGAESNPFYADDIKYGNMRSAEEYGATVEAFTYPDEFAECDGSVEVVEGVVIRQQNRAVFGLSYVTTIGNALTDNAGYIIHLIYGATASPTERNHQTINDSPEQENPSWEIATDPVNVEGYKPTSALEIDSRKVTAADLKELEDALYGTEGTVTYNEFTGAAFTAGTIYYEKNATTNKYFETTDTEKQNSKTYYTKSEVGGTDAYLPLPDEVIAFFSN